MESQDNKTCSNKNISDENSQDMTLPTEKRRAILHCDANCFFASVELLDHPELKDKCVAVAGSADERRGIILAKNEAAKKCHVQTAETIWQAKQKCPELILLPPHHGKYTHYSHIINEIYSQYTDRIEPFGIDESWLDVTGSYHLFAKTPLELADKIRNEVKTKTGITISVGVSFNKIFAKLGSDYKKPDATTCINPEDVETIVFPQPVENLLFVGKNALKVLHLLKIYTIGQLATADTEMLARELGKMGVQISKYAKGQDTSPVRFANDVPQPKSVGNGYTFRRDLLGFDDIKTATTVICENVATRLRKLGLKCTGVQIQIKDTDLASITRQKKLPYQTDLARDIKEAVLDLVRANWNLHQPIRKITVTAQGLTADDEPEQTSLYGDIKRASPRQEKLERTLDTIRGKYGRLSVMSANGIKDDLGLSIMESDDEE